MDISSLLEPSNGVGLWVRRFRQGQPLDNFCWYDILLATTINNEVQWGAFYPHLWMEEALSFFWLIWFIRLELGGSNDGTGFHVNDLSSPLWFWLRVRTCIWFRGFYFNHQQLLWATVNNLMPRALMEVAPLPGIFLCLSNGLLHLRIGLVVLILSIFSLSFVLWVGASLS